MDYAKVALEKHLQWKGKIEIVPTCPVETKDDLSIAYTPGVAAPCIQINKDVNDAYEYCRKWNLVAVVTDGTAVLGLGDIGPEAGMPVMEGKSVLFKAFGDVDAFPICLASKDVEEIVQAVKMIAPTFGGINLEDIAAPRCFEIEKRLKEELDIPGFEVLRDYVENVELKERPLSANTMGDITAMGNLFQKYITDEISQEDFCKKSQQITDSFF